MIFCLLLFAQISEPSKQTHEPIRACSEAAPKAVASKSQSTTKLSTDTALTEFDKFLAEFDKKPTKEKKQRAVTSDVACKLASDSAQASGSKSADEKRKAIVSHSSSASKSTPKRSGSSQPQPAKSSNDLNRLKSFKDTNSTEKQSEKLDCDSFMRLIEDDDDDDEAERKQEQTQNTAAEQDDYENLDKLSDIGDDDDDRNENDNNQDNQQLNFKLTDSERSGEESGMDMDDEYDHSDVEYMTDQEENEEPSSRLKKKKKLLSRTCMDDGDDDLYQERIKILEKSERDIEMSRTNGDQDQDQTETARLSLGYNNNEHVMLDDILKVPASIWDKLYKFQKTGIKWLWELHSQRCGGILGDEMGLGKTIQIICFLASLKYSRVRSMGFSYIGLGPTLIITPVTLISQWVKEFHRWWPYFRVCVLHDIGTYKTQPKHKLIEKVC
jgi:DNA excision repair protein ERCC-6